MALWASERVIVMNWHIFKICKLVQLQTSLCNYQAQENMISIVWYINNSLSLRHYLSCRLVQLVQVILNWESWVILLQIIWAPAGDTEAGELFSCRLFKLLQVILNHYHLLPWFERACNYGGAGLLSGPVRRPIWAPIKLIAASFFAITSFLVSKHSLHVSWIIQQFPICMNCLCLSYY